MNSVTVSRAFWRDLGFWVAVLMFGAGWFYMGGHSHDTMRENPALVFAGVAIFGGLGGMLAFRD